MRKKIVAGNWKMNNTLLDGMKLICEIDNMVKDEVRGDVKIVIIPPFIHLSAASQMLAGNEKISLGAQNCFHEKNGAYTGEISPYMLQAVNVKYVIVGHSERRSYFGED